MTPIEIAGRESSGVAGSVGQCLLNPNPDWLRRVPFLPSRQPLFSRTTLMQFRQEFLYNSNSSPLVNNPGVYDAVVTIPAGGVGSYTFPAADSPGAALLIDNAFSGSHLYGAWGQSTNPQPSVSNFAQRATFTVLPGATFPVLIPQGGQDTLYLSTASGGGRVGLFGGTLGLVYDAGTIIVTPGLPT